MKEYDEDEAVRLMCEAAGLEMSSAADTAVEVLDLIYDYYDANGELDISADDNNADTDVEDVAAYIEAQFAKNAPAVALTRSQIVAMIKAEVEYEESLI